ncbi:MAG: FRG domain-containing protein [Methanomicrobia archaeon]|nr:FRG domain-containing protein [Methanomicrobia archaeon]
MEKEAEYDDSKGWAFRGQDTSKFPASSLERHCKSLNLSGNNVADLEVKLIREFARRYHLYAGRAPPEKGYTLEWLSLLRHYGTPTRLVDFTYSFFIAVYFALEKEGEDAVVWAVNVTQLKKEADKCIASKLSEGQRLLKEYNKKRDGAPFRALFMRPNDRLRFVYPANPLRLNERLTIQQGVFLAPGDVTATFEENMEALPNYSKCLKKFVIDSGCRHEILRKLHELGINRATLFPGLEGFAQSLYTKSLILQRLLPQGVEMLEEV